MGEDKKVRLKIYTPVRTVFDSDVDSVVIRTAEGDMGVLYGHEPCSVQLNYGVLRVFTGKKQSDTFAVMGGVASVYENQVIILSPVAERPDQLDNVLEEIAKERAANVLREQSSEAELQRAEMALRRALVHMDIPAHSVFGELEKE